MSRDEQSLRVNVTNQYIAVLQAPSTQRLDALLDTIGQVDGVQKTTTSVVLAMRINREA